MSNISLKWLRENHPTISLKRFCDLTGLCYQYVLKLSKTPVAGEVYSEDSFNFKKVEELIAAHKIDLDSFDWDQIASTIKVAEPVSGLEEFVVGVQFKIRGSENICSIITRTDTHIVFLDTVDNQPHVMNNSTFAHQSPRIIK